MGADSTLRTAPARSRADTRRRLLAAGTDLFARQGLHAVTSAQVARRAGVAAGTFYLHFKDKQDLFREIVFEALEQLRERLDRATAAAGDDPQRAVRARTAEVLAFAEKHRSGVRILFGRDREAADLGEDVLSHLLPGVEAGLRRSIGRGDGSLGLDSTVAAQAFVGMWTRVVTWWVEDPRRASREVVIETLARLYPGCGGTGRTPQRDVKDRLKGARGNAGRARRGSASLERGESVNG